MIADQLRFYGRALALSIRDHQKFKNARFFRIPWCHTIHTLGGNLKRNANKIRRSRNPDYVCAPNLFICFLLSFLPYSRPSSQGKEKKIIIKKRRTQSVFFCCFVALFSFAAPRVIQISAIPCCWVGFARSKITLPLLLPSKLNKPGQSTNDYFRSTQIFFF